MSKQKIDYSVNVVISVSVPWKFYKEISNLYQNQNNKRDYHFSEFTSKLKESKHTFVKEVYKVAVENKANIVNFNIDLN